MKVYLKQLIAKTLMVQDNKAKTINKIIGSVLIILSGVILISDKVFTFELDNTYGFKHTAAFIWVFTQTVSSLMILIGYIFRPYITSFIVPVYIYSIQLYWIFNPDIRFDDYYLQSYAIAICIGFFLLLFVIMRINKMKSQKERENDLFLKEVGEVINLLKEKKD